MSANPDRLYELLPAVYRLRDADQGYPLQGLLRVITEQVNLVEADISQLYENWFIETCQDWVVPYIGDLIGYTQVHEAGEPDSSAATPRAEARNRILIPRREVANTIRYRRRKGTLALLEELAMAVAGWPARAVEFYRLLGVAQNINYVHLDRGFTADLRDGDALDLLDGPFDELAHTVDVRRIDSHRTAGRYNIPSVGVFVCRLKAYSVTNTRAYYLEEEGHNCYLFSALGNDTQLFTHPRSPAARPPGELDLPIPIRRRPFEEDLDNYYGDGKSLYGDGKSLRIWFGSGPDRTLVTRDQIIAADLTDWTYRPPADKVAVDPVLGRIVFPAHSTQFGAQKLRQGVWASYYYGFSADIGGGEYDRPIAQLPGPKLYLVGPQETSTDITAAIAQWRTDNPPNAVIEITESGLYDEREPVVINLQAEKQTLQIRAAKRTRPVIRLSDDLTVTGQTGSRLVLDGLLITGHGVQIVGPEANGAAAAGDLCSLTIRHSTLVPGWGLHCDCGPKHPAEPSLELFNTSARIIVEHSIIGSIQVDVDEAKLDPLQISISDSIVDATHRDRVALGLPAGCAYAVLTIARSTVIGEICAHAIELAQNSIFFGKVRVARRQQGCLRFCYAPPGSRTPRRYECQPDLVEKAVADEFQGSKGKMTPQERDALLESERLRVEPEFNSTRYGASAYCQLACLCAEEIKRGADDESEMGAFHDLYQPQRAANLHARLDEYTPAGMDAGIIYTT
jgi:hypothetical protein